MSDKSSSTADVTRVEVTLKKPHTQGRASYNKGEKIHVRPDQKIWLSERGII